jgi:hypothetical protein
MPIPRFRSLALACALALATTAPFHAAAQAASPAAQPVAPQQIPRIDGPITIDGVPDEAAWAQAREVEIAYEIGPGDNIAAPVRTIARIGYSTDALYLSFRADDPDPQRIRAHLRDRDSAFNDDWVGLFVDTFDDQRRGYEFIVNPLGVQADLINDATTGNEDPSWDGLWESAGRLTDTGYEVEIRIPFATLRFHRGEEAKRWALMLFRNYPRDKRHQLSSGKVPRGSNCFVCTWEKYEGMAGVQQGRNLEVVPTLTMGKVQTRDAAGAPWRNGDAEIEPGLDISWAPTPDMTLNATLNPDFSQVETDQLQLNFNDSFALFFPEKRPFFLEGADYFNTQFNVLYTRQVADPDFGLRVTGRGGNGAYGAFVARDATTLLLVPGVLGSGFRRLDQEANVAVGRYRYDLSPSASIGVIGTFRHGEDYGNDVVGIDGRWRTGGHTATAQVLRSQSEYPQAIVAGYRGELGDDATPTGNAWRAQYAFNNRNWNATVRHQAVDPGFRADLGFFGQVGYDQSLVGGGYNWFRDGKALNRISVYADWDITHRFDGQLLERELEGSVSVQGPRQSQFGASPLARERFWDGAMFREHNLNLWGNFRPTADLQLGTYMNFGQQLDLRASRTGRRAMVGQWGNINLGRGGSLQWDFSRQRLQRDGGTAFEASIADVRMGWQLDPRQRLRLTLQGSEVIRDPALYTGFVNQVARNLGAQVVYSYKVNPRTAVYAGASAGGFMDDDNRELFGNTRSLFLKFSYGWQPQF